MHLVQNFMKKLQKFLYSSTDLNRGLQLERLAI